MQEWQAFTFCDGDDWWEARGTHGSRVPLEQMAPDQLERYKHDAFAHLRTLSQAGPLTQRLQFLFALGTI